MRWTWVAVGAAFLAGAVAGRGAPAKAAAGVAAPVTHEEPAAACTDAAAMTANARLVDELRAAQRDARLASERARTAETQVTKASTAAPARLVPTTADWARMARENVVSFRQPCGTWDAMQHTSYRTEHGGHYRGGGSVSRVADMYRVTPEDRQTLADAYARAHKRTWAEVRSLCEATPEAKPEVKAEEGAEPADPTDAQRIDACATALLATSSDRASLHDLAALRARGDDATTPDERLRALSSLSAAPQVLFEEVVKSFGREQAGVLVDRGLLCLDDTTYDLRPRNGS